MIPSRAQREAFPPLGLRSAPGQVAARLLAFIFIGLALVQPIVNWLLPSSVEEVAKNCAEGECLPFCQLNANLSLGIGPRLQLPLNEEFVLVHYDVEGDRLGTPRPTDAPPYLLTFQMDEKAHQRIWNLFTALIPVAYREGLNEFGLFTGGEYAGYYDPNSRTDHWSLYVNIADIQYPDELTKTLIHEYGHRLTLNASQQMPVSGRPCEQAELYGCLRPEAYLNLFYEAFWGDIYAEWEQAHTDPSGALMSRFYENHRESFITWYASTNPVEDIAESWTYFILSPKPKPTFEASRKILFFYDFPELVELRNQIIYGLCSF